MRLRRALAVLLLCFVFRVAAQQSPQIAKGFRADTTYDFSNLEAVNLFNGSITLALPIGQLYSVGPNLSYRFNLAYTGNNWIPETNTLVEVDPLGAITEKTVHYNEPYVGLAPEHGSHVGLGWHFSLGQLRGATYIAPDGSHHDFEHWLGTPTSTSTGNNPLVLYTSDGTYLRLRHILTSTGALDRSEIDFPDGNTHVFDYLGRLVEMRDALPPDANGVYPNRVGFSYVASDVEGTSKIVITDSIGRTHTLTMKRMASVGPQAPQDPENGDNADLGKTEEPWYYDVVTQATLAAFNGGAATYTFAYSDADGNAATLETAAISRKYAATTDCHVPPSTNVPLLESVRFPDGTDYKFVYDRGNVHFFSDEFRAPVQTPTASVYRIRVDNGGSNYTTAPSVAFTGGGGTGAVAHAVVSNGVVTEIKIDNVGTGYTTPPTVQITPNGSGSGAKATAFFCERHGGFSGNVTSVTLPTGGSIGWNYRVWNFPPGFNGGRCTTDTGVTGPCGRTESHAVGVGSRLTKRDNGTVAAKRTYSSELKRLATFDTVFQITSVQDYKDFATDGSGGSVESETLHYYSASPKLIQGDANAIPAEYGLPFTRYADPEADLAKKVVNPKDIGGVKTYLSTKTFSGSAASGTLERTTYVAYEGEHSPNSYAASANRRVQADCVVHDDGKYVLTSRTNFNGLGHYGTTTVSSDIASTPTKTAVTNYTAQANQIVDHKDAAQIAPATWITGAADATSVAEGTKTVKTELCFDRQLLLKKRVIADTSTAARGADDLVAVYTYDVRGNVTSESFYGGDRADTAEAGLGTGALCTLSALGTRDYHLVHDPIVPSAGDWTHTSKYSGMTFLSSDVTVDRNTGFVSSSRDTAAVETAYGFDTSGRLSWTKPTGHASTWYTYPTPPSRTVTVEQHAGSTLSATPLTRSTYTFDSLGRLEKESTAMPGNTTSVRTTTYDHLGRRKWVSELVAEGTTNPPVTQFVYDYAGRVTSTTAPDGSATSHAYTGATSHARTTRIWTGVDGDAAAAGTQDTAVTVTDTYDGHGRLVGVNEPSGPTSAAAPAGALVKTEYGYDPAGRLTVVRMRGAEAAAPVQIRTFAYDGRGLLTREEHPESGITLYRNYDARGHVGLKLQGSDRENETFDLKYTYDAAERLTHIDYRNPWYNPSSPSGGSAQFRPGKEFVFADVNDGANLKLGKLEQALRYNFAPTHETYGYQGGDAFLVTETYQYNDSAGRRTDRATEIAQYDAGNLVKKLSIKTVRQHVDYDELGNVAKVTYPTCDYCGESAKMISSVERKYSAGRLTSVPGFVTDVQYWPTGTLKSLTHANGIVDARDADPHGLPRPRSIQFGAWAECIPPAITAGGQPASKTIASGSSAELSTSATGTGPLTYQWYERDSFGLGRLIAGATAATYRTPPLTTTTKYFVHVRGQCNSVFSETATVTVHAQPPVIAGQPEGGKVDRGGSMTLSVDASGTGSLSFAWYRGASGDTANAVGTNAPSFTTPALTTTTQYWVRVSNASGAVNSNVAAVTVALPTPQNLTAVRSGDTTVKVSWAAVTGASSYSLERKGDGTDFTEIGALAGTSFDDASRTAGRAYVYRVRALDASGGSLSQYSNHDLATMMTFATITAGQTTISASHFTPILEGLNAIRAAGGWPPVTWSAILPVGVSAPGTGGIVSAAQISTLRARLDEALHGVGVSMTPYTDTDAFSRTCRAVHIHELQRRMQ